MKKIEINRENSKKKIEKIHKKVKKIEKSRKKSNQYKTIERGRKKIEKKIKKIEKTKKNSSPSNPMPISFDQFSVAHPAAPKTALDSSIGRIHRPIAQTSHSYSKIA